MTLPHGFGSNPDPERPIKKCRLGKQCRSYERCKTHEWSHTHSDVMFGIMFVVVIIVAIVGIAVVFVVVSTISDISQAPFIKNISGFNCKQLAEYVADKKEVWTYAEHRYEWLCVNQQVKEFQG